MFAIRRRTRQRPHKVYIYSSPASNSKPTVCLPMCLWHSLGRKKAPVTFKFGAVSLPMISKIKKMYFFARHNKYKDKNWYWYSLGGSEEFVQKWRKSPALTQYYKILNSVLCGTLRKTLQTSYNAYIVLISIKWWWVQQTRLRSNIIFLFLTIKSKDKCSRGLNKTSSTTWYKLLQSRLRIQWSYPGMEAISCKMQFNWFSLPFVIKSKIIRCLNIR